MGNVRRLIAAVCALASPLIPQGAPGKPEQKDGVLALIAEAEKLHKADQDEDASLKLRSARKLVLQDVTGAMRESLGKSIDSLLTKTDPLRAERHKGFRAVAAALIKLARSYQDRKWYRTALQLLLTADPYDPAAVEKAMATLRRRAGRALDASVVNGEEVAKAKQPPRQRTDTLDRLPDLFAKVRSPSGWKLTKTLVTSPPITESCVLLASKPKHGDGEVSIEAQVPASNGCAALIFGAADAGNYFMLELQFHPEGQVRAVVWRWQEPKIEVVGENWLKLPVQSLTDWHKYAVRIKGKAVSVRVDDRPAFEAECPRVPHGELGMFVNGGSPSKDPVRFRRLLVVAPEDLERVGASKGELEAMNEDAVKQSEQDAVLAAIETAEEAIAKKQGEAAFLTLLKAKELSSAFESNLLHKTVEETIRKLIDQCNPIDHQHYAAGTTAAEALIAVAKAYTGRGWHRSARDVLLLARSMDPGATAEPLAANAEILAPILVKLHGYPAESQGNTDNAALLEWFKGGREPWGRGTWTVDAEGATGPADVSGATLLLSPKQLGGKGRFSVQARGRTGQCFFGVALGYKSPYSLYILGLSTRPGEESEVYLAKWAGTKLESVAPHKRLRFSPEARSQWMTIAVEYGDSTVKAKFGDAPAVTFPVTGDLSGNIGLTTNVDSGRPIVRFRNLRILGDK